MPSSQGHEAMRVVESEQLTRRVKRVVIEGGVGARPGQYVMAWVPKVGEIPLSVAKEREGLIWFLVAKVGKVSSAIHSLGPGDLLWIRGPYGHGFTIPNRGRIALVGGGYGIAPLIHLADTISRESAGASIRIRFYAGFRSKEEVMLEDLLMELVDELVISTDDGSYGLKGYITEHVDYEWPDYIFTAGPEPMLVRIVREGLEKGKRVEASLERLIRCAVGVCGACVLDPLGLLVCRDGPVFEGELLLRSDDFGMYWRDFDGSKIPLGGR